MYCATEDTKKPQCSEIFIYHKLTPRIFSSSAEGDEFDHESHVVLRGILWSIIDRSIPRYEYEKKDQN